MAFIPLYFFKEQELDNFAKQINSGGNLFPSIGIVKMEQKNKQQIFIKRLFVAFLIPVVLSLSTLPCCPPSENCADDVQHACADEPIQGTFPASGLCSPFFTCGHCPGFIIQQVEFPSLNLGKVNEIVSGNRPEFKPFILVKSFFKPPKA
mgnify:CR=1 FL=1